MPQSGFTTIQVYRSSTAAATPSAVNLNAGELAINDNDGKLFYKDNAGVVQVIGVKNPLSTASTLPIANGGTGQTTAPAALAALGGAPLVSPTFSGTPAAPTAAPGTSTTQLATTAFVQTTAFSSALPAQTGNAGKFVTTNGTVASWANVGGGDTANNIGYLNIPQNSQSAAYTLVLADAGKQIYHPSADTTARTWTIPANASVAFPIGTAITFINDTSAGVITIAITSDTMVLAGAGTTGSRTLAANGIATAVKMTATRWIISGTGLT